MTDDWLRTVPTNSKVFLHGLLNMQEKQILTSVIKIQKKIWGRWLINNICKKAVKWKAIYDVFFFQTEAWLSLKNAWLPPIFFLDTKSTC